MARTIVITSRHDLGIDGVKARIDERFAALKAAYIDRIGAADLHWDGKTGRATVTTLGATGAATFAVSESDLKIEIVLPMLLTPLGGFVESLVRGNADALRLAA